MEVTTKIAKPEDTLKIQSQLLALGAELAKGKVHECTIKPIKAKRSLDANAYCWVLCEKIAEKVKTTKEDIYKRIIRQVGVWEVLPIRNDVVESWVYRWSKKGLGWFCESLGDSKLKGYTNIASYFGSSTYDSKEMARLIDEVIENAKDLGIETKTPDEIAQMKSLWGTSK